MITAYEVESTWWTYKLSPQLAQQEHAALNADEHQDYVEYQGGYPTLLQYKWKH